MKILQINNNFDRVGGAETVFHNTINLLKSHGHEVISFTKKNSLFYEVTENNYFIESSKNKLKKIYWKEAADQIKQIVQNERPNVAHIHNLIGEISFSILPVLKKMKIPVVMTVHDYRLLCPTTNFLQKDISICEKCKHGQYHNCIKYNCSPGGLFKSIAVAGESYFRDLFIPFSKYIDYFIFPSQFIKNKFLEVFPEIAHRCIKLHNFSQAFYLEAASKSYFLFIGRLAREKGLYTLIEAFRSFPEQKLIIVGGGPNKADIEKIGAPNIIIAGYKNEAELKKIIMDSFFVIVPSECYENNPMAIIEAYSNGKPVIGTNIGGIPEVIEDGVTGFLFTPKDIIGLSELINKCLGINDIKYNSFSKNAYEYSIAKFSPDNHYKHLVDVYESVCAQNDY
jgi:glycosyltransferase involved in cell wall biosynthesis